MGSVQIFKSKFKQASKRQIPELHIFAKKFQKRNSLTTLTKLQNVLIIFSLFWVVKAQMAVRLKLRWQTYEFYFEVEFLLRK